VTGPPVLWHFPISHYNEKARWALDWKGKMTQDLAQHVSRLDSWR